MAPRKEILDSEDEGDDFGSVNGEDNDAQDSQPALVDVPGDGHNHDAIEQHSLPPSDKTTRNSTDSTDPAFFQRIYEEQQAAACAQDATTQATTPRKGTVAGEVDPWELPMSPPPATRSMGSGSASRSSGRITRSSEKRRQSDQTSSLPVGPEVDPYDFPSTADISPVRPSKRKKRNPKSSLPQQSHTSEAVQETTDLSWGIQGGQAPGPDSSMPPPTLPAMYIATSALTDSQKQQYQSVNISSQIEPEHRDFAENIGVYPNNGPYKSSGATTIAYPTPSRFASSAPGGIVSDALPYAALPKDFDDPVATEPMSSPDELAGSAPTNRTKSQATHKAGPPSQVESSVTGRRTRRRTSPVDYGGSFDEPIVLDNTQPPNQVFGNDTSDFICDQKWQPGNDNQQNNPKRDLVETTAPAIPEPAPPKKKRGRKKKDQTIEEPIFEEGVGGGILPSEESSKLELDAPLPSDEIEEPPTKKRRGRPRKSDTAKATTNAAAEPKSQIGDEAIDDYAMEAEGQAPAKRGKGGKGQKAGKKPTKKKEVDDTDDEDPESKEDLGEPEESRSLSDISHNPRPTTKLSRIEKTPDEDDGAESKENSDDREEKKVPGEGEDIKKPDISNKATPGPASKVNPMTPTPGKVRYRVGLSRNTRITPLLKSLKK